MKINDSVNTELTHYHTMPHFDTPKIFSCRKHCEKGEIAFKGSYLDFSHPTKLQNLYITEIYKKKQYKSSIRYNHKITKKNFFDGVPLKKLRSLLSYLRQEKKKHCGDIQ